MAQITDLSHKLAEIINVLHLKDSAIALDRHST